MSPIDAAAIARTVRAQGYCLVPELLPRAKAEELASAISGLQEEDRQRFGAERIYQLGQEGFVINVGDRGAPFEWLLNARPAQEAVSALLGPSACLYLFQGVVVPPGGGIGAYPWKWHCDLFHVLRDVGDPDFLPGINTLFFVDDVDERNGGTWIVPGSQGLQELPAGDPAFLNAAAMQLSAPKGSAVLFNPLLWHCAGANHTDRPRRAVKMLFVRDWLLPQMDYARSLRPEVLARLDAGALGLLGHPSRPARAFSELSAEPAL